MAGRADTWMPLYVADYLRDTMHLTRDEHGAYMLLIMAAWSSGGRLPNRPRALAGIVKASLAEWEELAPSILPFFMVDGDDLIHGRVVAEAEKARRLSESRREIGRLGGRPKKQTETVAKAIGFLDESVGKANGEANGKQRGLQTETPSPSPSPREEDADASLVADGDDEKPSGQKFDPRFLEAWDAYPHVKGRSSRPKAYPLWRKAAKAVGSAGRLKGAIERFAREGREPKADCGAKGFHLWLRDALYDDWLAKPGETPDAPAAAAPKPVWQGPPAIRKRLADYHGEGFAAAWLDRCAWRDLPTPTIVAPTDFIASRLRRDASFLLDGVEIIHEAPAAAA